MTPRETSECVVCIPKEYRRACDANLRRSERRGAALLSCQGERDAFARMQAAQVLAMRKQEAKGGKQAGELAGVRLELEETRRLVWIVGGVGVLVGIAVAVGVVAALKVSEGQGAAPGS